MTNLEVMETWFQRVWSEEDESAIDEMFVPDGEARGLGANILVGPDGFKQFHSAICAMCSDIKITIDKSIEEGDWISCICTFTAKATRTGQPITATGAVMVRIGDGKLLEAYNHWDFFSIYEPVGLLPENTFGRALIGEKIA